MKSYTFTEIFEDKDMRNERYAELKISNAKNLIKYSESHIAGVNDKGKKFGGNTWFIARSAR